MLAIQKISNHIHTLIRYSLRLAAVFGPLPTGDHEQFKTDALEINIKPVKTSHKADDSLGTV